MPPKRSKNQIRRERAKLRKVQPSGPAGDTVPEAVKTAEKSVILDSTKTDTTESNVIDAEHKDTGKSTQGNEEPGVKNEDSNTDPTPETAQKLPSNADQDNTDLMREYSTVFQRFEAHHETLPLVPHQNESDLDRDSESDSESEYESESEAEKLLSKRQLRQKNRIPIAQLKAFTKHPEAVEWYDADAPDPFLVVEIKTMPNVVDVPSHWQQKKDYLSAKRGMDRPPFRLPKYIYDTGIAQMRNHDPESLKKLQRDRVQPKMGRLDIDYQKLHDAFFKFQTIPRLLPFGELYYEGREKNDINRDQIQHMRPGKISRALRAAVGLPENEKSIPPWVVLMNELGKPPAYKDCVIPGVDIAYTNLGYKLARDEDWVGVDMTELMWGHMEEGEESEAESEAESESESESEKRDEEEKEKEQETGNVEQNGSEGESEDEPEKVDITEYSRIKTFGGGEESEPSSGTLYTVLKEKSLDASHGLVEGRQGYEYDDTGKAETDFKF